MDNDWLCCDTVFDTNLKCAKFEWVVIRTNGEARPRLLKTQSQSGRFPWSGAGASSRQDNEHY